MQSGISGPSANRAEVIRKIQRWNRRVEDRDTRLDALPDPSTLILSPLVIRSLVLALSVCRAFSSGVVRTRSTTMEGFARHAKSRGKRDKHIFIRKPAQTCSRRRDHGSVACFASLRTMQHNAMHDCSAICQQQSKAVKRQILGFVSLHPTEITHDGA